MKLEIIANLLGCSIAPDERAIEIKHITSIDEADEYSVTFLSDQKYLAAALTTRAAAIIVKKGVTLEAKIALPVADPYVGYARVAQLFEERHYRHGTGINPTAVIHPEAIVHPSASIGPYTVVEKGCKIGAGTIVDGHCMIEYGVTIGEECRLDPGVVVRRECMLGNRVIIQAGAIIGSEGFGNALENGKFIRIPCFGIVILDDDVEIGANVTIDRGNFKPTHIHKGVRIDNLVHIAHNVEIGEHSALCGQVGISGSVKIGKHVMALGQAGFVGHINVGDGVFVGAKAGVSKNIAPGSKITGHPARELIHVRRIEACQQQLPELIREIKKLREDVARLKNERDSGTTLPSKNPS